MNPTFAEATDGVFLTALAILRNLQQEPGTEPRGVQQRLVRSIDDAESKLRGQKWAREWEFAKYALVAWLDEMLVAEREFDWEGREWWSNNVLEVHYFKSRMCSTRFFEQARDALEANFLNAFEVYYDCVLLGFQGMYRDRLLAEQMAPALRLSPHLDTLVSDAHRRLKLTSLPLVVEGRRPQLVLARPEHSARMTRWAVALAVVLLACNLALGWIL
ncbi:MAG TPA: hypothetical protein DDY91_06990 [Planctomycetaceae bacterium]|nr:hypothetical protein [Planctomycetaceae bacterium]